MLTFIRVKCLFTFSDIKTFVGSPQRSTHELRQFSLSLTDRDSIVFSNTLYEQLIQNIQTSFRIFSLGLVSNGQPFHLYWKNEAGDFTAFDRRNELMEAIFNMMPYGVLPVLAKTNDTLGAFITADFLKIYVCVLDKSSAAITHPSALLVNLNPTKSTAATSAVASVSSATTTTEAAATKASWPATLPSTTIYNSSISPTTSSTSQPNAHPIASQSVITAYEINSTQHSTMPAVPTTTTTTTAALASWTEATKATSTSSNVTTTATSTSTQASLNECIAVEINASQQLTTQSAPAASNAALSSDENSSDEYDVIKME